MVLYTSINHKLNVYYYEVYINPNYFSFNPINR